MKDHYFVLGIPPSSTTHEIRSAYHCLVLQYHPDKRTPRHGDDASLLDARFLEIMKAWQVLGNETSRKEYDLSMQCCSASTEVSIADFHKNEAAGGLVLSCRCGDIYEFSSEDVEDGVNTVQCNGCSLFVTITN